MREKLTAAFCARNSQPGRYADGGGLYLLIKPDGRKTWVFRWRDRITGKLRDKGLGTYGKHDVTLAEARKEAGECRRMVRNLKDPIAEGRRALQEAKIAHARLMTFEDCANRYIEAHKASWRNKKHAAQWPATLNTYAKKLMPLPVDEIDTGIVIKCLEPIWTTKTETATRVRQRIEAVLDWATVRGFRQGDNPARWRGHLDHLLPQPTKLKKTKHRPSLPYSEIGAFTSELRDKDSQAAKALELQILTATRPGEVVGAKWDEFDLNAKTWTIPADRMKANKEHEIPLSKRAVEILRSLPRMRSCEFVFPGQSLKKSMTTAAAMKLIKDIRPGITAHGFRATFRDWAAEQTSYPREVIEHALAHQLKDKTEAAYQRSSLLPKRVKLMDAWANHCNTIPAETASVTPINAKA